MTITEQDFHEAIADHKASTDLLQAQQGRLAFLENELTVLRDDLNELQQRVERKRRLVNDLQESVTRNATRCLEIQVALEAQQRLEMGEAA